MKIAILTGAGVSADSGLKTFRDHDGLWENYSVYEVATPEAWQNDQRLVLQFYNQRRSDVANAKPNAGHLALVKLENHFKDTMIITQNIDNLHERAGSKNIIHLHGRVDQSRSTLTGKVFPIVGLELNPGDLCPQGSQLRPDVVWFGEQVPMLEKAIPYFTGADIVIVAGSSLGVYPAASLINYVSSEARKFVVDPNVPSIPDLKDYVLYTENSVTGLPKLVDYLISL
jgi:NAD-dependent deacetylase